jgi:hypothetical protein
MTFVLGRLQQEAGTWKKTYLRGRASAIAEATRSFAERNFAQRFPAFELALDALRSIEAQEGSAQERFYLIESDPAAHDH